MSVELLRYDDSLLPEIATIYYNKSEATWDRIYACMSRHEDSLLEFSQVVFRFRTSLVVRDHLFRYRHASMAAGGLRYNEPTEFVLPEEASDEAKAILQDIYRTSLEAYRLLRDDRVKREVARYLAPCGARVTYAIQFNVRSLAKNVFPERLGPGVQPETRRVAEEMWGLVHAKHPELWDRVRAVYLPSLSK